MLYETPLMVILYELPEFKSLFRLLSVQNLKEREHIALEESTSIFRLDRESILLLKGMAILFVVLGHMQYISGGGSVGVTLFLIMSGYGLSLSCDTVGFHDYWRKRLSKVWLPYVLVGLFDVIAQSVRDPHQIFCTLLGLDLDLIADKTMWYISFIMLWYLIFYLASLITAFLPKQMLRSLLRLLLLCTATPLIQFLFQIGFWHSASSAAGYRWFFPLGVALSLLEKIRIRERNRQLLWAGCAFACTAVVARCYPQNLNVALPALTLLSLALFQLSSPSGWIKKALLWLGLHSYQIYLLELLVIRNKNTWFAPFQVQFLIDLAGFILILVLAFSYKKLFQFLSSILLVSRSY